MKINVVTLGCPKNTVDSEYLMAGLKSPGITFVADSKKADVIIINTCAFILSAREESIETILAAIRLKDAGQCEYVFIAGCLPQKFKEELIKELPEVDGFFDQLDFADIASFISKKLVLSEPANRGRELTTPNHYAYLKIAEGCNNNCSYCTIPSIKGRFSSRDENSLVDEAIRLAENGTKEIILIAQDITYYGRDRSGSVTLPGLIEKISLIQGVEWIRLLYAHPAHVDDKLIFLMKDNEKVCKYIDIPVQHISDHILKRMGRKTTGSEIRKLIAKMQTEIPQLAIRTTLMVGFPGETEDDFRELKDFVVQTQFDRVGVFKYSNEDDTYAATLSDHLDESLKEERHQQIMEIQRTISFEKNARFMNKRVRVIVDNFDRQEKCYIGRTQWDSPEIDNRVLINKGVKRGRFYNCRIVGTDDYDLIGVIEK